MEARNFSISEMHIFRNTTQSCISRYFLKGQGKGHGEDMVRPTFAIFLPDPMMRRQ